MSFRKKLYSKIEKTIQIDDRNLLYAEDKDLIYKLEEQAEAGFIPQVLYKYRYVKDSATHSQEKRNLGAKNHFLLQKEALQRRNIKGLKKKMYHFLFFLTYQYYSLTILFLSVLVFAYYRSYFNRICIFFTRYGQTYFTSHSSKGLNLGKKCSFVIDYSCFRRELNYTVDYFIFKPR